MPGFLKMCSYTLQSNSRNKIQQDSERANWLYSQADSVEESMAKRHYKQTANTHDLLCPEAQLTRQLSETSSELEHHDEAATMTQSGQRLQWYKQLVSQTKDNVFM